ncbi:MAG: glycosyltransferase family 2 protein [Acidimicrobiales bacterium]
MLQAVAEGCGAAATRFVVPEHLVPEAERASSRMQGPSTVVTAGPAWFAGTTTEPPAELKVAYGEMAPGECLVAVAARGDDRDGKVDRLSTQLFFAGFDKARVRRRGRWLVATGTRSAAAPPPQRRQTLSVIMPVYNERETFRKVFDELVGKSLPDIDIQIIVVESNSTDGTREEVREIADHERVVVVLEDQPRGKGHAVRRGLTEATGDYVLFQDADLEYELDDYERLIRPLREGTASFVLGFRRTSNGRWGMRDFDRQPLISHIMNLGHIGFLFLFNTVYRQHLKDPFTMYKVFRRDCVTDLNLECNRFDFDWELTAKLIRTGYKPLEIPVTYRSRSFSAGKKVTMFRDPVTWIAACAKHRFSSLHRSP